jgi:hypothetical protein
VKKHAEIPGSVDLTLFVCFVFGGTGDRTLMFDRQELLTLESHLQLFFACLRYLFIYLLWYWGLNSASTLSHFNRPFFEVGSLELFAWAGL